jgi:hypothetical protein
VYKALCLGPFLIYKLPSARRSVTLLPRKLAHLAFSLRHLLWICGAARLPSQRGFCLLLTILLIFDTRLLQYQRSPSLAPGSTMSPHGRSTACFGLLALVLSILPDGSTAQNATYIERIADVNTECKTCSHTLCPNTLFYSQGDALNVTCWTRGTKIIGDT